MVFCTAVGIVAIAIVAEIGLALLWGEVLNDEEDKETCVGMLLAIHAAAVFVIAFMLGVEQCQQ